MVCSKDSGGDTEMAGCAGTVTGEIQNVLASMWKNRRWALGARMVPDEATESPLVASFKGLLSFVVPNISKSHVFIMSKDNFPFTVDFAHLTFTPNPMATDSLAPVKTFKPFVDIILSEETTGPITGTALTAVDKLLKTGLIGLSQSSVHAVTLVADAACHCKFEATDTAADEVVLMKIVVVLISCLQCPVGPLLPSSIVVEALHTCYRIGAQHRLSEILRTTAEDAMHTIIGIVFHRIPALIEATSTDNNSNSDGSSDTNLDTDSETTTSKPYDIGCLLEIMKLVTDMTWSSRPEDFMLVSVDEDAGSSSQGPNIIDGGDETTRLLGFQLLISALEAAGGGISLSAELLEAVKTDICPRVYYNARSGNLAIMASVYRLIAILYESCIDKIKLEFGVFINGILHHTAESTSSSFEHVELALQTISQFTHMKYFGSDLFYNYDCDIQLGNYFEDLCKFLSKNTFPVSGHLNSIHLISLDALIGVLSSLNKICYGEQNLDTKLAPASELREKKHLKRLLNVGAAHFNRDFRKGLSFLQGVNLLPDPLTARSVAALLRHTASLDKARIGIYIGEPDKFNLDVLKEFTALHDFKGLRFDTALRRFLCSFLLAGEGQKIGRIMEHFAEQYHSQNPTVLANADTAYLLAYSVIMLHTDHHNPSVRNKMTLDQFVKNNRGLNAGKDLPRSMLVELYENITQNEIKLPHMVSDASSAESRWADALGPAAVDVSSAQASGFDLTFRSVKGRAREYAKDIFATVWGPAAAAFSVIYDSTDDAVILDQCIQGFKLCASVSSADRLSDIFDNLMISLCKFTLLQSSVQPDTLIDPALIAIGGDPKAQRALIAAFSLARQYSGVMREGWMSILDCMIRLLSLDLISLGQARVGLPASELDEADVITAQPTPKTAQSGSLFSTFTSYLSMGSDEEDELVKEEAMKMAATHAKEIVEACNISDLIGKSGDMQSDSLIYLVKALILASVWPEKSNDSTQSRLKSEVSAMFCLELLASVTYLNRHRVILLWLLVYEHLSSIISSSNEPTGMVKRAVGCLLRLCVHMIEREEIVEQLVRALRFLLDLPAAVEAAVAPRMALAVGEISRRGAGSVLSSDGWDTLFAILKICTKHPKAASSVTAALAEIIDSSTSTGLRDFVVKPALSVISSLVASSASPNGAIIGIDLFGSIHTVLTASSEWTALSDDNAHTSTANLNGTPTALSIWLELCSSLQALCHDRRAEVRSSSLKALQHIVLAASAETLPSKAWYLCIDVILFPLFDSVLAEGVTLSSHPNIDETRLRACALFSQVFLQYLGKLSTLGEFPLLWRRTLKYFDKLSAAENSPLLAENVPEYLRNLLLAMISTDCLVPPKRDLRPILGINVGEEKEEKEQTIEKRDSLLLPEESLWLFTWEAIAAISNDLHDDLIQSAMNDYANRAKKEDDAEAEEEIVQKEGEGEAKKEEEVVDISEKKEETSVESAEEEPEEKSDETSDS